LGKTPYRNRDVLVHFEDAFAEPLNYGPARGIPLKDVRIDVGDFGVLALVMRSRGLDFPVRLMGEGAVLVPILPPVGLLRPPFYYFPEANFSEVAEVMHRVLRSANGENVRSATVPVDVAQQEFFKGLKSFLAALIAGVRWALGGPPPATGKASGSAERDIDRRPGNPPNCRRDSALRA
jgi:hypothetical protein